MTPQEAKKELSSLKNLTTYMRKVKRQRDEMWNKFTAIKITNYDSNGVFGGVGKPDDRICASVDKLCELEDKLAKAFYTAQEKEKELTDKIMAVDYPYSEILLRRFVETQTFEKIAYEMRYSFNYVKFRALPIAIRKYADGK